MREGENRRRRVLVPHALGADEFLRVTWHEGKQVLVFSHWDGDHCVAATPVRVADIGELAELAVAALSSQARQRSNVWAPPDPGEIVSNPALASLA